MITINNLSVAYTKDENVLDDLDCQMQTNAIHGIVGLNGSGKTTLINTLFGLKKAQKGELLFNDKKLTKKDIAYLPTDNFFYSRITAKEYLQIFENPSFKTDEWNALFNLPLDKVIETYSTGMKKKVALMGILKKDKPIMILDEPFNGLDIETGRIIRTVLLKLKEKEKTILVTSHILETLTNMCDFIHFLEDGKIKCSIGKDEFAAFEKKLLGSLEDKNRKVIDGLIS
jgi:ABC-2 type transport system ATP-binding protein